MTEPTTAGKFQKWERPIMGGLLTSLTAVTLILAWPSLYDLVGFPIPLIGVGFSTPGWIIGGVLLGANSFYFDFASALISFLVWFSVGAITAYFIKKNLWTIIFLSLLVLILGIFSPS